MKKGLVKIKTWKDGSNKNRTVTFSAVLDIVDYQNREYVIASVVPPLTLSQTNEGELAIIGERFFNKTIGYLKRRGFNVYN